MKKQLLTLALVLTTGATLHASPQASAAAQARAYESPAIGTVRYRFVCPGGRAADHLVEEHYKGNGRWESLIGELVRPSTPHVGERQYHAGPDGSGQMYEYQGDGKWKFLWGCHGLQVHSWILKYPSLNRTWDLEELLRNKQKNINHHEETSK